MMLKDVMLFAEESLGHEIGGPLWLSQSVRYIQSCLYEWDCLECSEVSAFLDIES